MKLFFRKQRQDIDIVKKPWWREYGEALLVAAILAIIIRTFVIQAFKIPSGSMEDTLLIGDHLLVNKFIYGIQVPFADERYFAIRGPKRGDVIVFEFPRDAYKPWLQRRDFIKRVIGLPGDVIEIRDKKVYVNGKLYQIPQEVHKEEGIVGPQYGPRDNMKPVRVPPGHYFVMGDNRDRSYDSRFWGFVPKEKILGLAFIKYWSWDSERHLPRWSRIGQPIE
ncbi:signal peptidase I [Geothermobacter ehrlichii]|uniref:Signal peptidase I n=1 Tax=Geothermobacter ehrlichii TaxID=213224 RepID=A0A5D3WPN8_9BACT|nr:signal peptidase I [Geothermobacter ehrlichii]TYP00314.1 signal peptidase I [Geothermobacter ehrlichii]